MSNISDNLNYLYYDTQEWKKVVPLYQKKRQIWEKAQIGLLFK